MFKWFIHSFNKTINKMKKAILTEQEKSILRQVDTMDRAEYNKLEQAMLDRGVPVEDIREYHRTMPDFDPLKNGYDLVKI